VSNPTKQLGTQHETDIVNWLKVHGWPWARRRTQKGSKDEGDLCLSERIPFTIEAKTARKTTERAALGTWLRELEAEVTNVGDIAGAVVFKRRGTTDVGEYIAVMPVKYLNLLLTGYFQDNERKVAQDSDTPERKRLIRRSQPG
jgi:hypothetical protein